MKSAMILVFLAAVVFATARPDSHYTDRYDNINVDEIIGNRRLLDPYVKCLLDLGKCTPEGKELKSHIKEALENNCKLCTDMQKKRTRQVIGHLINHEPQYWDQLSKKYDPTKKFTLTYEKELRQLTA